MIEKERLEELIKQGTTIYRCYADVGVYGLRLKNVRVDTAHLWVNGRIGIPLNSLFETKEDAEFALKYQNITRTETLNLPTFEEFCKYEYVDFFTSKGKHCWLEICLDSPTGRFRMAEGFMFTHIWDLTKENYYAACELCRKLFLGEEV